MEFLSVTPQSSSSSSTKVLTLDGTTVKSRTAEQIRIDGNGASTTHGASHRINGSDPTNLSQVQVYDNVLLEDGSFLLAEDGTTLVTQGVDDIRPIITQLRTVSGPGLVLGRKTSGSGFFEECTLTDVLDFVGGVAQGDILYRGATGWTRLGAGTNGQFLKTQGPSANPVWATVSGGAASKQADFSVLPYPGISQLGDVYNTLHNDAFPSPGNSPIFRTEFVPTNFTVSLWCFNGTVAAAASGQCGVKLQYSTSPNNTGWQDVPNSTINVLNQSGAFLFSTSTVSIPNSPSAVYWRLVWVSTLLDSDSPPNVVYGVFVGHSVMIRLWN